MSSNAPYHETDAQLGGSAGLYGNQNGGTPPGPTDPELQLQESLGQLRGASDMMHAGAPQGQQMGGLNAHHQFQTPPRPTHSPQQMAQSVMSLEDHGMYGDHDSASRKRSKVSRACDECRRKKVGCRTRCMWTSLMPSRFGAMRPARTVLRPARAASGPVRAANSVGSP
jgi:hypothetical protein